MEPQAGIEHPDVARVFERADAGYGRAAGAALPGEVLLLRLLPGGALFAGFQKDLVGPADEVAAVVLEPGLALRHLIPEAAEGVVGEELDDVAWGEELVADGQLAAVARRRRFVAHLPTFFRRIVVFSRLKNSEPYVEKDFGKSGVPDQPT